MWIALVILNIFHPGTILVGPESVYPKKTKLSRKEKKALKQEARNETIASLELEEQMTRPKRKKHGRDKQQSAQSEAREQL